MFALELCVVAFDVGHHAIAKDLLWFCWLCRLWLGQQRPVVLVVLVVFVPPLVGLVVVATTGAGGHGHGWNGI